MQLPYVCLQSATTTERLLPYHFEIPLHFLWLNMSTKGQNMF
jgi:hypothetical protein